MSRKKKNKRKVIPQTIKVDSNSARDISQKIKSLQSNPSIKNIQTDPTGSLPSKSNRSTNYVEDRSQDIYMEGTQANYKDLYEEEKINNVFSEINNKTSLVEAKLSAELEKMKAFIESKFSSFTKWGIGVIIAVIGIPIGGFYFLLNNQTEKIESKIDLKMEKRISPIETKIKDIQKTDSLKNTFRKNMPNQ